MMAYLGAYRVINAAVTTLRGGLLAAIRESEQATGLDLRQSEVRCVWELGSGNSGLVPGMTAVLRRLDGTTLVAAAEVVAITETDDPGTYSISFRPEHNATYHLEVDESTNGLKKFDEFIVTDAEPVYLPYLSTEPGPHGSPVVIEVLEREVQAEQPYVDAKTGRIRSLVSFEVLMTFANESMEQLEPAIDRARLWQAGVFQVLLSNPELGDDCIVDTVPETGAPGWEILGDDEAKSLQVTANVLAISRVEERHL